VDEDRIYAALATELETGNLDKGLWTRLFAECSGNEQQMKILYIKQRAERLISAERIIAEKAEAERIAVHNAFLSQNPTYCPNCQKYDAFINIHGKKYCPNCGTYVKLLV
jgi:hypothetical protein